MAAFEERSERHGSSGSATQDDEQSLLLISPVPRGSKSTQSHYIIFKCFFLSICMEISNILITIPLNQILESIICRQLVSDHHLSNGLDPRCKNENVQRELSFIRGWQLTFDLIPGLLTAIMYGLAAKKYGRQFILALAVLGATLAATFVLVVCSFPAVFSPRLVWLSSTFTFIGGGVPVFNAMIFALLSDAVHESKRSTTFFYVNATPIGSQVVGSLMASALIRMSVWVSAYCGALLAMLATLTAFFFSVDVSQGRSAPDILLQYVTKRYGWTWADSSLLLSMHWLITLILLTAVLPAVTQFLLQARGMPSQTTDLLLARVSVVASSVGAFVIGASTNVPLMAVGLGLFTLSYAYPMLARSLLASVVDKRHTDVMYTTISIFEALGSIIAGPLLSASFRQGLVWGTEWLGLPFLLAGALFGSAVILLSSVGLVSNFETNLEP
ncbi:Major facilitator superfamily domain, general substrate transporter [Beauveria brongniartii RCEF 3172]|uniref:Major facilitator superfamily domain, general substrate transporter n=1 Tax=Beauveria brongniartii RCEF 3172 TaxID=1081107 RepID=A0A162JR25_9HYPO|nr:Major facilitator superfamily domain, general substrate transporter [Beauveria brongniartii RCEF 3172]